MNYAQAYHNLLLEHRAMTSRAFKHLEAYEHERALRIAADNQCAKLVNTVKVMTYMQDKADHKLDLLRTKIKKTMADSSNMDLSDIKIDILV